MIPFTKPKVGLLSVQERVKDGSRTTGSILVKKTVSALLANLMLVKLKTKTTKQKIICRSSKRAQNLLKINNKKQKRVR